MHRLRPGLWLVSASVVVAAWAMFAGTAAAQTSSMYGPPQQRSPLTLNDCSWTLQMPEEPRTIKLHDLLTVVVDEKSVMISDGQMDRKKKAHGDLILKNWLKLRGLSIIPAPQTEGDPHIRGEVDNKMRSEASMETRDSLTFRIACNVVDIRPNGNLVIEGRRQIQNNEDTWDYSLTGEIRPEAIRPNNSVLSEDVAEMKIIKREQGHVRDGYRRGWLLELLDKWQPF